MQQLQRETVPASSGLELRKCFSYAGFQVLPGVGHLPYEEAPAEFNRCLLLFLGDPFVT